MDIEVLFKLTPVTETFAAVTVTVHVAVFPPSLVFAVIVAVPAAFAVTTPEEDTVATEVLLEDQVTDLSVAFEGVIVAVSVCVSPTVMDIEVLFRLTPVTETVLAFTVTVHVAVFPPSLVFTVIVAVPAAFAVTTPEEDTVATEVLLEVQVTDLSVAFEGVIVAVNVWVSPSVIVRDVLSRLTPKTEILAGLTVTEQLADAFPSSLLHKIVVVPALTAWTTPDEDTVATDGFVEDQLTPLIEALLGTVDAIRVNDSPSVNAIEALFRLIWDTKIASTTMAHGELSTPLAIAVIVALPT